MFTSDVDIRQAVQKYCQRVFSTDLSLDPPFVFSEWHTQIMQKMLSRADRKHTAKRVARRTAACLAAALVIFVTACVVSPRVWAAVRSWYVINIGPDQIVYEFEHKENDHAFLVVRPNTLPEGFKLKQLDEGDGYSIQNYDNASTGEYIDFRCHWITVREQAKLEGLIEKYGTTHLAIGYDVVFYQENGLNKMAWYDKYNLISYWVESNLPQEEIIAAFDNMEIHPPVYVPDWVPEGYELIDAYCDAANCDLIYLNAEIEDILAIGSTDLGWTQKLFIEGEGESRIVNINGIAGTVYWGEDYYKGTIMVLIDEKNNIGITIQTNRVDPELVIKIAEHLIKQGSIPIM